MKKNILIVIHKLSGGGAERAACELANVLQKKHNVTIVTFYLEKNSYECDANIINLNNKTKFNWLSNVLKLKKIKRENSIDYSISFLTFPNFINVLSREKDKVILTIHSNLKMQKKRKIVQILHKYSCQKADKVVCVSEGVRQSQIEDFQVDKNKVSTIYNSCNMEKIKQLSQEEIPEMYRSIFESSNVILNVGRLEAIKMQDCLIRAFKEVVKEVPDSKLIILGEGKQKENLLELIKTLNLENYVFLLGFDPNPYKYIKQSTLFLLTSKCEGLPTVLVEAMALKIPVISCDCDFGPREILARRKRKIHDVSYEEYGVLIPNCLSKNYEEWIAKSITDLLKDKQRRNYYSEKAIERLEEFSEQKIIEQWEKVLDDLR